MILQPNRWSCGLASIAMITDLPMAYFINFLGHDGSEIVLPNYSEPKCRRGFVINEFIDALYPKGLTLVGIEAGPLIEDEIAVFPNEESRLLGYMKNHSGLLEGRYALDRPHICAWDRNNILDPMDGREYAVDDPNAMGIEIFWMLIKIDF